MHACPHFHIAGGAGDMGNSKNDGRAQAGMNLTPADFAWITSVILSVARVTCPGRVVSVLEGGYGQWKWMKVPASSAAAAADNTSATDKNAAAGAGAPPDATAELLQAPLVAGAPDASSVHSSSCGSEGGGMVSVPYLHRDNLAENCVAHVRALFE
ncbi:hypothetical protein EON62_04430, partial [archaeon]